MSEKQELSVNEMLGKIYQHQYEEIEKKNSQLWDLEEENRVLRRKIDALQEEITRKSRRVIELEAWCKYLQACLDREKQYNIPARIARKIKRMIFGC